MCTFHTASVHIIIYIMSKGERSSHAYAGARTHTAHDRGRVSNALSVIYTRLAFRPRYILDRNWKINPAINKRVISGSQLDSDRPDMENDIPLHPTNRHPPSETTIYRPPTTPHCAGPRLSGWTNFTAIQTTKNGLFRWTGWVARHGAVNRSPLPRWAFYANPSHTKAWPPSAAATSGGPFSTVPLLL